MATQIVVVRAGHAAGAGRQLGADAVVDQRQPDPPRGRAGTGPQTADADLAADAAAALRAAAAAPSAAIRFLRRVGQTR